ncbi:senescence-induced receptor-like serine/threonine-protein kinase [Corylus avellana]|uniref:senescence-induced receptor-like serine/threonine-protein kinase n=1 Tax=Corylus avellana TaxID=13451 RepID=UPI00286C643F|nr:senescence-induced receptor-like serine/threonine-protein kinase [Corylus avellana]
MRWKKHETDPTEDIEGLCPREMYWVEHTDKSSDILSEMEKKWKISSLKVMAIGRVNEVYTGYPVSGTDEDSINIETGIRYKSDKELVSIGTVETISLDSCGDSQSLKNLRSFPVGTRNCYTLTPEQGKNNNYLVRASFCYGNYDGKNITPIFDLYLGPNRWGTVKSHDIVNFAIIHVPSTDYIDVYLVKTGDGVPFISALELRRLDNSIYHIEDGALATIRRYDIGMETSESSFRYPIDPYDRYWNPLLFDNWTPITTDSTIYSQGNDNAYKLPAKVLRTAAKTPNASIPLSLSWSPPDSLSKCYVYFHFAEIEKLGAGQQRVLTINLNGERNLAESIKLDYLRPLTIVQDDPPISGSRLYFSINAAEGTKFPPILNAVEIFVLKKLPNKTTAIDDVEAIMQIKEQYSVIRNWQGDPCVPIEYSWDGLNCSNDNPPKIISLITAMGLLYMLTLRSKVTVPVTNSYFVTGTVMFD